MKTTIVILFAIAVIATVLLFVFGRITEGSMAAGCAALISYLGELLVKVEAENKTLKKEKENQGRRIDALIDHLKSK